MKKGQFQDVGVSPGELRSPAAARALAARHAGAAVCHQSADAALAKFDRGAHIFGLTRGQFSMIDLVSVVLKKVGPADVSLWTWCVSDYGVSTLGVFLDAGTIERFRMVIDWTGAQRDAPWIAELQDRFGVDCIRVTKTHAKVVTVSTADGWRITIRGSMNLNKNPRFENFDISDDPLIFGVVSGFEDEMWSRGKPLPLRELKHSDADGLYKSSKTADEVPEWASADCDGGRGDW